MVFYILCFFFILVLNFILDIGCYVKEKLLIEILILKIIIIMIIDRSIVVIRDNFLIIGLRNGIN